MNDCHDFRRILPWQKRLLTKRAILLSGKAVCPLVCRFLGRRHDGAIDVFGRPASEKRQGTKSRSVLRRRFGGLYGDLARRRGVRSLDRNGCLGKYQTCKMTTARQKKTAAQFRGPLIVVPGDQTTNKCAICLKAVVHTEAGEVGFELDVDVAAATGRAARRCAEIDIEIFELGRPIAQEGIFDADAGGPAKLAFRF